MADSTIITGQFVRISQVPASVGERIFARAIDYVILIIYLISVTFFMGALSIFKSSGTNYLFIVLFFYLPALCYSLLFEVFNNGQSPGKMLFRIRVVKSDGTTPTLSAYLMRWLLYLFDVNITGGLGLIVIIVTKNNQRLGDLAAGTMVVKEKNYKKIQVSLDEFEHLSEYYKPIFPQAADLSLEQINLISRTLDSKNDDRVRHIEQLSSKVSELLSIDRKDLIPEKFLRTIVRDYQYYALEII